MTRITGPVRWLKRLLWAAVLIFTVVQLWFIGHILWWSDHPVGETRFMALRLAELRSRKPEATLSYRWIPYSQMSGHIKRAVVAAEDDGFVEHDGFDWEAMQKALEKNQRHGRTVAGGSTITQQLAKNLFLSPEKSYPRKVQEALIALYLEALLPKRRILEIYLNVVEWGDGLFGVSAAAQRYFGVSAAALTPAQAARLAVMLPNPRRYEKQFGPRLEAHAARIIARMPHAMVP